MHSKIKAGSIVAALVATLALCGAAVASAATVPTRTGASNLSTTGVSFTGHYSFHSPGYDHGGMGYPGKICDTSADGNPVRVHAKVEGYGYGSSTWERRGNGNCTTEDQYVYDPAALYVTQGKIEACQDRGVLPDLCKASPTYYR